MGNINLTKSIYVWLTIRTNVKKGDIEIKKLMLFILVGILISSCQENKEKTFICNGNPKAPAGSAHREDYSVTLRGKEADFSKFACLGNGYSRDEKSVYILDYKIRGADPKTFKYITGVYAKDKDNIFYADKKIKKVDFETFQIVDAAGAYSKDNNYVYYEDVKLKGAVILKPF